MRHIGAEQKSHSKWKVKINKALGKGTHDHNLDAYPEILHIISRVISVTQKSCILAASCGPPPSYETSDLTNLTKAQQMGMPGSNYRPNIDCQTNTEKWRIRGCLLSEWRNSYLTGIKNLTKVFQETSPNIDLRTFDGCRKGRAMSHMWCSIE